MTDQAIRSSATETVDIRDAGPEEGIVDFRILKRRYVDSYVRCEIPSGRLGFFLENMLIEIVDAGPEGAAEVAARRGYQFDGDPVFARARRGLLEVSGRLVRVEALPIPEPAQPVLQ